MTPMPRRLLRFSLACPSTGSVLLCLVAALKLSGMALAASTAAVLLGLGGIAGAAPPLPRVIVAEAVSDRFADRIEALGTLKAKESVDLTTSVTETVTAIHFDDGNRVEAGTILVEMTNAEEHALLEEARANLAEAAQQYERLKSLAAQGTAAKSLLDERRRDWDGAKARLAAIESRLADRLIRAPFTGVLGLRNISLGALVEPGDLVATLDDDSVMKLEFPVASRYLPVLRPGLSVVADAPAFGPKEFQGTIKSIASRVDPVTRSIEVRALLPNPTRTLKPGVLMRVVLLSSPREAVVIPEQALLPLGASQYVLVVAASDGNKVSRREVRIGGRRPGEVEVLEGLKAGEIVITEGSQKVRPGQTVEILAVDDKGRPRSEMLSGVVQTGSTQ